jgi:hypothetical protein
MNPKTLIQSSFPKNTKKRSPRKSVRTDVHELFGGESLCKDYPTEGEIVSCERGIEDREQRIQRQREQNAYNRRNRGWFF